VSVRPGSSAALLLSCSLAACAGPSRRPAEPPADPQRRRQLEVEACWARTLPAWLDDTALSRAATLDRQEAEASRANEAFHGATYSSQPLPAVSGRRVAALMDERRAFQQRCAALTGSR
jgi:hypothetical protein